MHGTFFIFKNGSKIINLEAVYRCSFLLRWKARSTFSEIFQEAFNALSVFITGNRIKFLGRYISVRQTDTIFTQEPFLSVYRPNRRVSVAAFDNFLCKLKYYKVKNIQINFITILKFIKISNYQKNNYEVLFDNCFHV